MFDNLDCLSAPKAQDQCDELDKYLSSDPVHVVDALKWWYDRRKIYPRLSIRRDRGKGHTVCFQARVWLQTGRGMDSHTLAIPYPYALVYGFHTNF